MRIIYGSQCKVNYKVNIQTTGYIPIGRLVQIITSQNSRGLRTLVLVKGNLCQ
jgi:hypothetical protein